MDKNKAFFLLKVILVFAFLYFFLVSIGLMGAAFKGFGKGFAESLLRTTANPFVGLFIGIFATSIVQSSSTTTSIVVGMVASGVLSIGNAIPIVMGSNIGTTVTNTLVSIGHITRREEFKRAIAGATVHDFFNLICVAVLFPLELATGFLRRLATSLSGLFVDFGGIKFTSPIKTATKPAVHLIKDFFTEHLSFSPHVVYSLMLMTSVVILFVALYCIVKLMRSLVISRTETFLNYVFGEKGYVGILAGFMFTTVVQSSSITTSLLVPLIGAGIITVEVAFPITLGANIGTTTTAILASFATGNPAAVTIAFVHLLFNCTGILFLYPIRVCRKVPIALARGFGELVFRKRGYAFVYVVIVFFVLPAFMIIIF